MGKFGWLVFAILFLVACEGTTSPAAAGDIAVTPSIDTTIEDPDGAAGDGSIDGGVDGALTNDGVDATDGSDAADGTDTTVGTDGSDVTDPNAHTTVLICGTPPAKGWCHRDGDEWLCCDANGEPDFSVSDAAKQVDCKEVAE